jgi:type IV fimbrial biogenesis protein FimT
MLEPLMGQARSRRARGFTLIELAVVVAVSVVLLMVVAPSFGAFFAAKRVEGLANEVGTDLQFARSEAVQKNRVVRMEFTAGGYEIWLMTRADATVKDHTLKTVSLSGLGTLALVDPIPAAIVFEPVRGLATTAGDLVVGNASGSSRLQVSVTAAGRTRICVPSGYSMVGYSSCA